MSKRKILLVSYYFPPLGGVGTYRALKLARFLPGLGWDVHVLTPKYAHYYCIDNTLVDQVPAGVEVHRTESLDPFRLFGRLRGRKSRDTLDGTRSDPLFGKITRAAKGLNTWLFVPDNKIGWLRFAAREGARVVREENIDLVYTINVPQTCHLIGRDIKRATGVPWVADFRDAWMANPDLRPPTPIHRAISGRLERSVLAEADRVVAVNDTIRDLLRYSGDLPDGKALTIHNGFDPDDFRDLPRKKFDRFTMVFIGTFHKRTDPRLLLRPYAAALRSGRIGKGKSRIVIVGGQAERTAKAVRELGLDEDVELTGFLAHRDSLEWMASADLLLQVIATGPGSEQIVSGKLYEYMAAGRPVLSIGPPGEARKMVEELHLGHVADVDDSGGVEGALVELCRQHYAAGGIRLEPDRPSIDRYSFPSQTQLLEKTLTSLLPAG